MPSTILLNSFEKDDTVSLAQEWTVTGSPTLPTTGPRGGTCLSLPNGASVEKAFRASSADIIIGMRLSISALVTNEIFARIYTNVGGSVTLSLINNVLSISGNSVTWYGLRQLIPNVWWYLEFPIKLADSGGSYSAYINGSTVVDSAAATGDTKAATATAYSRLRLEGNNGGGTIKIADLYAIDSSTPADKWGSTRVSGYLPSGSGTYNELSPSGGGAGTTSNYLEVDDATVDTATYVKGTSGKDAYAVPALGFTAAAALRSVWVKQTSLAEDASGRTVTTRCVSGASDADHATLASPGLSYLVDSFPYDNNPNTAAAWTQAQYEAAKFGPSIA